MSGVALLPNKKLGAANVHASAVDYQWEDNSYGEVWNCMEANECSECGQVLVTDIGEHIHNDIDYESDCRGSVYSDGPVMSYYYPLDRLDYEYTDGAKMLEGLPLCLVWFLDREKIGMALTGGGMDLSWEVCEAYIRLGQLPPLSCVDLPAMAGLKLTRRNRRIISACQESVRWAREQLKYKQAKLKGLRDDLRIRKPVHRYGKRK